MKTTVYKNASIVTGLSVFERCLGFLYRVTLSRLIGAEGLGIYQVALSLFSLLLTLGAGGVPITLSRMLAKNKAEGKRAEGSWLSAGILLVLSVTLPLCLFLWGFGGNMRFLFSDMRSFQVLKILLCGLCFSAVYAVVRGYFWGRKQFFTASVIELSEEIVMVVCGVLLLQNVSSPLEGAEKAATALVLSYLVSCLLALFCFFKNGGRFSQPQPALKPLLSSATPVTLVRASGSLVGSAVAVLFPVMLVRAGASDAEALRLFGIVSGMVLPVLFIPSTLLGSLSLVLVPELSEDYYRNNTARLHRNVERGLRFAFAIACLLLPFFFVLGEDVGRLAFSDAAAGRLIVKSCPILLPMSLTMISTSMLNSIGFEKYTMRFYFIGAAALLLCILFLSATCGVYAYLVGLFASYFLTALCNLVFLHKRCPVFAKRWGGLCLRFLFPLLILVLPLSLWGQFVLSLSKRFLGAWLSVCCAFVLLSAASYVGYACTKLFQKNVNK